MSVTKTALRIHLPFRLLPHGHLSRWDVHKSPWIDGQTTPLDLPGFEDSRGLPPFLRCFDSRQWHTCSSVYEFTTTLWFPGLPLVLFRLYHAHHEDLSAVATATTTATAYTKQFIWVMPLFLGFRAAFTSIDWTWDTLHLTKTTTIGNDITIHTFSLQFFIRSAK